MIPQVCGLLLFGLMADTTRKKENRAQTIELGLSGRVDVAGDVSKVRGALQVEIQVHSSAIWKVVRLRSAKVSADA